MKIAIFTDLYTPSGSGGIVTSIRGQKAELEKLGHEVWIFCPGQETQEERVVLVPSHARLRIGGAVMAMRPGVILEFLRREHPELKDFDVIHVQYEASCSIAGVLIAQELGIPLVQTMHGREDMAITYNVPHPLKWLAAAGLERLHHHYLPHRQKLKRDQYQAPTRARARMWRLMVGQAAQADVVITPAQHFAQKLEHYGVPGPIRVVSNGIDRKMVDYEFAPRQYADGDVLRLVWNSRMSNEKRFGVLLEALRQLRRPYILYVYGEGNSLKRDRKFAEKHRLKVKFYGQQPRAKILERIKTSHLNVLTSYNFDVQPMVMIESQALGMPVLVCDPTLAEMMPQGGYLLATGTDATSIAMALEKFPAGAIEQMSKVMTRRRGEVYQEASVRGLLAAYKEACEKKQRMGGSKA